MTTKKMRRSKKPAKSSIKRVKRSLKSKKTKRSKKYRKPSRSPIRRVRKSKKGSKKSKKSKRSKRKSSKKSSKKSRKLKLIKIVKSPIKEKKYRAYFSTGKHTDFGASGYSDFIHHKDPERKKRYIERHRKRENWKNPKTAGALSLYILWNKKTFRASLSDYKKRFNL